MLMHVDMVYREPTWAVALLVVALAVGGAVVLELIARRFVPLETRRQGNDVAAAMFSVIRVLFAVLLAFVVMLTYEGYSNARETTVAEASAARAVADAGSGLAEPARTSLQRAMVAYLDDVVGREWPAQAEGRTDDSGSALLDRMVAVASADRPSAMSDAGGHAALLSALAGLRSAREMRRLAAASHVPAIVWAVMLMGGALTVAAGSFLAAPNARMHLVMSATLAASGALVVVVVLVLDQPFRGDIRISPAPLERVRVSLLSGSS